MTLNKTKFYLFFAGITLLTVGSYIGFVPVDYLRQFFTHDDFSLDSLSEIRGMGGSLFLVGAFVFFGAFRQALESASLILACLIFCAFSLFRTLGIAIDGMPSEGILFALSIEAFFAILAIMLLKANRNPRQAST